MTHRKAKDKGPRFERLMCGRLSLWVSNRTREDVFWRSAMSGGRARLKSQKADRSSPGRVQLKVKFEAQMGDIAATHRIGHDFLEFFIAECKFYRELKWYSIVYGCLSPKEIYWWKDLLQMREATGREPFLIMKENRQPEVVATTSKGLEILRRGGKLNPNVYFPKYDMHVFLWRDLMVNVDFSAMLKGRRNTVERVRLLERA